MNRLLGNGPINRAPERGIPAQAYLICGEPGSGKKTLARLMAEKITGDRSGRAARGEHPDVFWLGPKEAGKMIPVEEVRALRREAFVLPNEAPRKVLIIDRAEALNESGQNAILKVLEEPPERAVFLLLAVNRQAMLPTIRSRCVLWELGPVGPEEGVPFLKERFPQNPDTQAALRAAGGNLGLACTYLEGGTLFTYAELGVRFLGRLCRGKRLAADQLLSELPKGAFPAFLESFARLCRDFLLYKTGSGEENIVFLESILQIKGFLGRMKLEQLYKMASLTLDSKSMLANYGNENLVKTCFIAEMGELLN